ncbi:hypothetical protein [Vulcanisaeta distributa]|uniref:hypothetical protein n=1 Tax=Vulcanisaeta distributa TaxID=164451 RepID=UPI001FB2434E|nr:hypothetical protein [Vulcanisaeta distributa]
MYMDLSGIEDFEGGKFPGVSDFLGGRHGLSNKDRVPIYQVRISQLVGLGLMLGGVRRTSRAFTQLVR